LAHAGEASVANGVLGYVGKEAFDEIEPGTSGWREMNMETGMVREPRPDAFMFVGA
jgi:hypothetical protein